MIWPSAKVRDTFLQYFLRHPRLPHAYVPSSSIVPRNDPTLAFCNAGMNQFKEVILGYRRPMHPRIVNSQKCLRINDLQLVGADSYHHTFFEMLGNWSFSNYYKKDACAMAWDLLTNVYGLDPQRLYVTYFSGGESVPADRETKEIWEDLGVSPARILPFGKDNFWAMGPIGPCGPSTEIHYDHRGTSSDPSLVNRDIGTVVEIWNLVFMQYNRTDKGTLERLPLAHVVDTGAGLERLTAVMNGKVSNYDTDLFYPVFDTIHKLTLTRPYEGSFHTELDRNYRIFADHMRAAIIALSDGILPQTNHKIRRLIQRSIALTESHFLPKVDCEDQVGDFLDEIVDTIAGSLAHVYPEIDKMRDETMDILDNEVHRYISASKTKSTYHEVLPSLLTTDYPALVRIKNTDIEKVQNAGVVDGKTAFRWYDSHGVTDEAIEEMCASLNLEFDREGFQVEMSKVKKIFRDEIAKKISTNEENVFTRKVESLLSFYNPNTSGGVFQPISEISKESDILVEWIMDEDGDPVEEISHDETSYWVLLNKTPFYPGSSSIVSDIGSIELEDDCSVSITNVKQLPSGWILHQVIDIPEIGFRKKSKVIKFNIDNERRCGRGLSYDSMYHLKTWFQKNYDVVRFNEEFVSWDHIRLEVTIMSGDLNHQEIQKFEHHIRQLGIPVSLSKKVGKQNGTYELRIATGGRAEAALKFGAEVSEIVSDLKEIISTPDLNYAGIRYIMKEHVQHLYDCLNHEDIPLPYDVSLQTEKVLSETERLIQRNEVLYETERIAAELSSLSQSENSFLVESFETDVEFSSLVKLSRAAGKKPVLLVIFSSDGFVQARCVVPQQETTAEFTAEKWMGCFVEQLGRGIYHAPKGQDPKLVVNLKRIRVPEIEDVLSNGLKEAREYVTRTRARQQTTPSVIDEKSSRQSQQSDQ